MNSPIRIVYRSKKVSVPLLAAIDASNGWDKAGLDVEHLEYVAGAAQSDPKLINEEIDFIFGSHVSPYVHKSKGIDFVCLGSTVNWVTDWLVTKEPVDNLTAMRGQVVATDRTKDGNHPWGNHRLYLLRGGVDLTEVEWAGGDATAPKRKSWELVADGTAFAAFSMPPSHKLAEKAGLTVTRLPHLPMVQSTTLTTLWKTRTERTDLCRKLISAVRAGIHFYKNNPDVMLERMHTDVAEALAVTDMDAMTDLYHLNRDLLEDRLYPTAQAILNAYRLAVFNDPSIQGVVNPLELWDTELLREADKAGA